MYKLLGVRKTTTSAYHPNGNGSVERVNRIMAQVLAMVVHERRLGRPFTARGIRLYIPSAPPPC